VTPPQPVCCSVRSFALHEKAEPPAFPRGSSLQRAPRGAGWFGGDVVRAEERADAELSTAEIGLENDLKKTFPKPFPL